MFLRYGKYFHKIITTKTSLSNSMKIKSQIYQLLAFKDFVIISNHSSIERPIEIVKG